MIHLCSRDTAVCPHFKFLSPAQLLAQQLSSSSFAAALQRCDTAMSSVGADDGMEMDVCGASQAESTSPMKTSAAGIPGGQLVQHAKGPPSVADSSVSARRGQTQSGDELGTSLVAATACGSGASSSKGPNITFICAGCGKRKGLDERVPGFQYDRACKRAYDSLFKLAKKQGQIEWWNATKSDCRLLKRAIREYNAQCPGGVGRGRVRGTWSIAVYQEALRSESSVETRGQGQMMWKEEWVMWAASVAGGFKSRARALSEWDGWVNNMDYMVHDMGGPEGEELRFRVVVKTLVDSVNSIVAVKQMELTGKTVKKAGAKEIAELKDSVLAGHDDVAGVQSVEYSGFAKALAANTEADDTPFSSALLTEGFNHIDLKSTVMQKAMTKEQKAAAKARAKAAAAHGSLQ